MKTITAYLSVTLRCVELFYHFLALTGKSEATRQLKRWFCSKKSNQNSKYVYPDNTKEVKSDVERIYAQYGMSITDAINVFLYTSRSRGGLPFDLQPPVPSAVTIVAIEEVQEMKRNPYFRKTIQELFAGQTTNI